MKKEIISIAVAAVTACCACFSPVYAVEETAMVADEMSQNGVEITFPIEMSLCIVTPTGDNPRNPNVRFTGDAHITFCQTDENGEIIKQMGEWSWSEFSENRFTKVRFEQTVYSEEETVYFMFTVDNIDENYYPMWGWEETPGVIYKTIAITPSRREELIIHEEQREALGSTPENDPAPISFVISLLPNNAVRDESTTDGMYLIYGDANLDDNVTISDSVAILQYIANNEKYPLDDNARANADVYNPGDGITGNDANSIMKLDAGVIDSLPETLS